VPVGVPQGAIVFLDQSTGKAEIFRARNLMRFLWNIVDVDCPEKNNPLMNRVEFL
jgi:hypothetical protein